MNPKWMLLLGLGLFACQANAEQSVIIDAKAIGELPGANARAQAGVHEMSPEEANREKILRSGKASPRQKRELAMAALANSNKQAEQAFLAANKARPGVVSLPSGVQYKILSAGKGKKKPTDSSVIMCRYQGKLVDGTSFEKSDAGKPEPLNVAGLVPGLKEAVKLMLAGSKWQIVVPPQLAYGERGNRMVGPNAVLTYDMEIVAVN